MLKRLWAAFAAAVVLVSSASTGVAEAAEPDLVVDTSTAGHVTITVTGLADGQVGVYLGNQGAEYASEWLPVSGGGFETTFTTWGMTPAAFVTVLFCPVGGGGCNAAFSAVPFTPNDVPPAVTWPDVAVIGPQGPAYPVTVSDPSGGGVLRARYHYATEALARSGQTTLTFPNIKNVDPELVVVMRCQDATERFCAPTGVTSPSLAVRRSLPLEVWFNPTETTNGQPGLMRPDGLPETADVHLTVLTSEPGDYDFSWSVSKEDVPVADVGGTLPVTVTEIPDFYPRASVDIDLTALGTGNYKVQYHLSRDYGDVGVIVGDTQSYFSIDVTPPTAGVILARSSLYPHVDGYADTVGITATTSETERANAVIEIRNESGVLVHSWTGSTGDKYDWGGWTDAGPLAPSGVYSVTATVDDGVGNKTTSAPKSLTLSNQMLVKKTFTKTVVPAKTLEKTFIGKCSSLVRGVRGWTGSLGLHTDTKCTGSFKETLVETIHAIRVPAARSYGALRISTYGGSSKERPGSYLFFDMLTNKGEWGTNDVRLGHGLGLHDGPHRRGADYVWADRYLVWDVYTWGPAKYDVKSFTVNLTYTVLK